MTPRTLSSWLEVLAVLRRRDAPGHAALGMRLEELV